MLFLLLFISLIIFGFEADSDFRLKKRHVEIEIQDTVPNCDSENETENHRCNS